MYYFYPNQDIWKEITQDVPGPATLTLKWRDLLEALLRGRWFTLEDLVLLLHMNRKILNFQYKKYQIKVMCS